MKGATTDDNWVNGDVKISIHAPMKGATLKKGVDI